MQEFREFRGFALRDLFAIPDFQQHGVVVGEFHDQCFNHFTISGDADGFVLWAELDELLPDDFVFEIQVCRGASWLRFPKLHQRTELLIQFIQRIFPLQFAIK